MKVNKFLIINRKFKYGIVDMHFELNTENGVTSGGGRYKFDVENKKLFLYGDSSDYGAASVENIIAAINNTKFSNQLKGFSVLYWKGMWQPSKEEDYKLIVNI